MAIAQTFILSFLCVLFCCCSWLFCALRPFLSSGSAFKKKYFRHVNCAVEFSTCLHKNAWNAWKTQKLHFYSILLVLIQKPKIIIYQMHYFHNCAGHKSSPKFLFFLKCSDRSIFFFVFPNFCLFDAVFFGWIYVVKCILYIGR